MTCVTFSHDSSLVATGDMSGLVKVWGVEKREEVWSFEVSDLEVWVISFRRHVCMELCVLKGTKSDLVFIIKFTFI